MNADSPDTSDNPDSFDAVDPSGSGPSGPPGPPGSSGQSGTADGPGPLIRPALPRDVPTIRTLVEPYAERRILLAKDLVGYYEGVQEFLVAEVRGEVVGCGALHVIWEDLAEVRTLAVREDARGTGTGHLMLDALLARAVDLGLKRVFCLTFEVDFFTRHGFAPIVGEVVEQSVFHELLLSRDDGIAEFLDLARVKPNTLGNTRMLKSLDLA